ncbi:MAG: MFS transporter [Candidatus Micrarchaeota archaeon]|nr:MFS transporter [Candidatus Micrarchaeota archaeon]
MEGEQHYDKKYAQKSLLIFAAFIIIVMYIETMIISSLPSIAKQFDVNAANVSLVLSMYIVAGVALSPIVGKLADIYGKKKVLIRVLAIYSISVALTGFAPNFTSLVILRAFQGIGLTVFPLAISLIQEQFPRDKVPQALGIVGAMFGAGMSIGLPIGSFVSNTYGWQITYFTAVPFVLLFSILIGLFIKESRHMQPDAKVDYIGSIGLAVFLGSLVFALSEGATFGWGSNAIILLFAFAILVFALLIPYEKKNADAVLDFNLLKIRNVVAANLIFLAVGIGIFLAYQTFVYQFESPVPTGYGQSIFATGLLMVPFAIMSLIIPPIVGRFLPRFGVKPFYLFGSALTILGFLVAAFAPSILYLVIGAALVGIGLSGLNIPTMNLLVLSVEGRQIGLAASMNSVFGFFGSALGAPIAGVLIAVFGSAAAFQYSYFVAIIMSIIIIVISLFAKEVLGPTAAIKIPDSRVIKEV